MGSNAGLYYGMSGAASGVSSLAYGFNQSKALQLQGDMQKQVYDMNSKLAEFNADDVTRQGNKLAKQYNLKTKQVLGSQRVALAAQGIDLESGSALDTQDNTKYISNLDVMTIKSNAYKQAWGYKIEALQSSLQGEFAKFGGDNAARNTLLTGVTNAVSYGTQAAVYARRSNSRYDSFLDDWT
jgi:hypothetical protein